MKRTVLALVAAAFVADPRLVLAQPAAATTTLPAKDLPDPFADLVVPPAHGAPKQMTTGATRGIRVTGQPQARPVIGLEPAPPVPARAPR